MNNPIRVLREEHLLLQNAIKTAQQMQGIADNEIYHGKVHDIILFFRNFTETYHYPKEDSILYPVLKTRSIDPRVFKDLQNDHEDLEGLLADIIDAHVSYDYSTLRILMTRYLNLLSAQIATEDAAILSIADGLLSKEESGNIYNEFAALDKKDGLKETLHSRYTNIANQGI